MQAKYLVLVPMFVAVAGCGEKTETRESEAISGKAILREDIYASEVGYASEDAYAGEDVYVGEERAPPPEATAEAASAPHVDTERRLQPSVGLD